MKCTTPSSGRKQAGAAAVEFALVFPVVFLLLYGLISFGALLYTQLAVSRAVSDGAMAANLLSDACRPDIDPTCVFEDLVAGPIAEEVIDSLATSLVIPGSGAQTVSERRNTLRPLLNGAPLVVGVPTPCADGSGSCITITLRFPYGDGDGTRLLPALNIPGIGGTEAWLPDALVSEAVVRL